MSRRLRTLADLGESALIERITRRAGSAPARDWPLGIGDDAAILRPAPGSDLVLAMDAQVEHVHFRWGRETPRTVGRRALVVNLSDLAAMGAAPVGCLLSLAAPSMLPVAVFDGLIDGLVEEAERHGCPLVGGNLSSARSSSLHVTVVGRVPIGRALRRGLARRSGKRPARASLGPGDTLHVTGVLGAAALGRVRADQLGTRWTRVAEPRLGAGQRLARSRATTACIDLSDGLATDLAHLLEGSGLGAEIDVDRVPVQPGFVRRCAALGVDPLELIARGGEDYELLFARRPGRRPETDRALSARLGVAVRCIGRVVERPGVRGLPGGRAEHHF